MTKPTCFRGRGHCQLKDLFSDLESLTWRSKVQPQEQDIFRQTNPTCIKSPFWAPHLLILTRTKSARPGSNRTHIATQVRSSQPPFQLPLPRLTISLDSISEKCSCDSSCFEQIKIYSNIPINLLNSASDTHLHPHNHPSRLTWTCNTRSRKQTINRRRQARNNHHQISTSICRIPGPISSTLLPLLRTPHPSSTTLTSLDVVYTKIPLPSKTLSGSPTRNTQPRIPPS